MVKQLKVFIALWVICFAGSAQEKEVKNVILMIPDGTSLDVITLSRWYKAFAENGGNDSSTNQNINSAVFPSPLCFEEHLTGLVMTHSANGMISESASAATEMAIGKKTEAGFLGLSYDEKPYVTNMELARIEKKKSTGLVFTCEFPHATPAAFVAHCTDRKDYKTIKKQMLYSNLDVVFGGGYGGADVLLPEDEKVLKAQGYSVYRQLDEVKDHKAQNKIWGLFNTDTAYNGYMAFDLDRQTLHIKEPSLQEMTSKSIEILEKNPNGFFLMVEGSKVDWAAHANDAVGVVTEFLAFEKAVKIALDYAKKNKNTVVIVCTDHGNGGFSMGNNFSDKKTNYKNDSRYIQYNHLPYKIIVNSLMQYKLTGDGFERQLEKTNRLPDSLTQCFEKYYPNYYSTVVSKTKTNILDSINLYFSYKQKNDRVYASWSGMNHFVSDNAYIGWTTKGHTGEDIPLYIYHPGGYTLHGTVDNTQIAKYIADVLGIGEMNDEQNKKYFSELDLSNTKDFILQQDKLIFSKGKNKYEIHINTNMYYKNGVMNKLDCVNVLIADKLFSSPDLIQQLNNK